MTLLYQCGGWGLLSLHEFKYKTSMQKCLWVYVYKIQKKNEFPLCGVVCEKPGENLQKHMQISAVFIVFCNIARIKENSEQQNNVYERKWAKDELLLFSAGVYFVHVFLEYDTKKKYAKAMKNWKLFLRRFILLFFQPFVIYFISCYIIVCVSVYVYCLGMH